MKRICDKLVEFWLLGVAAFICIVVFIPIILLFIPTVILGFITSIFLDVAVPVKETGEWGDETL